MNALMKGNLISMRYFLSTFSLKTIPSFRLSFVLRWPLFHKVDNRVAFRHEIVKITDVNSLILPKLYNHLRIVIRQLILFERGSQWHLTDHFVQREQMRVLFWQDSLCDFTTNFFLSSCRVYQIQVDVGVDDEV